MKITLEHISKRFERHWIFKDINYSFSTAAGAYALLGQNGSGKSTLLRILSGMQTPSLGSIQFYNNTDTLIPAEELYRYVSFCAPAQELVEELTLQEFFDFHFSFKQLLPGLSVERIVEMTGLKEAVDKQVGSYSSGMKQRVKLAQAIFSDTPLLLLDEPCTNLDQKGTEQYREWMELYSKDRLVIVASNDEREYFFCREQLAIEDYK